MSTSEKDRMIRKRIPKSGHITTPEDRRNKLNPQKNLVSTTEENAVDLGNSGAAVKPTVTGGGVLAESLSPVTGSSLSGGIVPRILAESSSLVTISSPSAGVISRAQSSYPVTGSLPSAAAVSQICSSCNGLGVVPQGTPQRDDMDRTNLNRGSFHNLIWMCRFIFDGVVLTCLERYSEQFADSGAKILVVFMCYWATTLVWMKMTDGVHQGFSAIMEWASIIVKMTAIIYIKILELMGCNDIILFVIKCLLGIAINWLTHMALHQ